VEQVLHVKGRGGLPVKLAAARLTRCRAAVEAFSQSVYAAEEVTGSGAGGLQVPGGADTGQTDPIHPV
jgi:hypothetical protein